MTKSLKQQLLIFLLSAISLTWVITSLSSYFDIKNEVTKLFDAQLAQSAQELLSFSSHEVQEQLAFNQATQVTENIDPHFEEHFTDAHKVAYQIWVEPDILASRSKSAPKYRLGTQSQGFSNEVFNGEEWRIYVLKHPSQPITVYTAEHLNIRSEITNAIALKMVMPMIIALPLLALYIMFGVKSALFPLQKISNELATRSPTNFKPIDADDVPIEIKPLTDAMAKLFRRVENAFANEQRFTADASHELRTPLAGLKIQAQLALKNAENETQKRSLSQVIQGVDRASHLVTQLLTLARLEPDRDLNTTGADVNLSHLATEIITAISEDAFCKNIDLSLNQSCEGGHIHGDADILSIMMRNLIDNAIRYTPKDGAVLVTVSCNKEGVILQVDDSGSGVPDQDKEKVFERFYRRLGNEAPGVGLGLSIVGRIIELHHGEITLKNSPLGGLQVEVCFRDIYPISSKITPPIYP